MSSAISTITPARAPRRLRNRNWVGWGFVGPFLIVFLFVLIAPVIYSIYLSLFREQMIGGNDFVWFANYGSALTDPKFWESVGRVALLLAVQVPVMLGLALIAALALDSARLHWTPLFRLSIFLPYAVPAVVAALMWGFMYGSRFGLVGNLNHFFHIELPDPFSSNLVLASIGNIMVWQFTGYNMLIFFSALRVIPKEIYEAAEIDGANAWQVIRSIKVPSLRPAILITVIFSIIGTSQLFNEPQILQVLSPNTISTYFSPNMYAYNLSFAGQQYNYSAAIAIIMGVIVMIIAYSVQLGGTRKEG